MPQPRSDRRDQILQALASMLEAGPETKITTARLAEEVGVSEAALYRHFPSKTKMFEALIEFAEETVFTRIKLILSDEQSAVDACNRILMLLLGFCERNPGITRILTGDPLAGETDRLRQRVTQLFDRIEAQLRQILREMPMRGESEFPGDPVVAANLMLSVAEGRISQDVRSDFSRLPTTEWEVQWQSLQKGLWASSQLV